MRSISSAGSWKADHVVQRPGNLGWLYGSGVARPDEANRPPRRSSGEPYQTRPRYEHSSRDRTATRDRRDRHNQQRKQRIEDRNEADYVKIELAGETHSFSPLLLRDMCDCPRCVDASSRQKLFSTVDIPHDIGATVQPANSGNGIVRLRWQNDIPGFDEDHDSTFAIDRLRRAARVEGTQFSLAPLPQRVLWSAERQEADVPDVAYEAYMSDDAVLHQALAKLHTHGLLFLTNVPESESPVSTIVERIGPLKTTFYGSTWDVRSVPQAKNVAYTAQDLGFHMDLMYMHQPPHLQFLHCIRSSSAGGASLFTDSFRAARDLWNTDPHAFAELTQLKVSFHYDHPGSEYYQRSRSVLELQPPRRGGPTRTQMGELRQMRGTDHDTTQYTNAEEWTRAVAWAPPFQGPFSDSLKFEEDQPVSRVGVLSRNMRRWHAAASKFNDMIHKPDGIYERMMKPGECVMFDNRRVLHGRRAFEVDDIGKERWLRGAYMDRDPYMSRMRVLRSKFEPATTVQ